MNIFEKQGIIISAERAEFTAEENARRSADMVHALVDIVGWDGSIVPCTGCFEGTEEQAYIVTVNDAVANDPELAHSFMGEILFTAWKFDQEAILVFHDEDARLLEIPEFVITGEGTDEDITETLLFAYTVGESTGLVSELMHFEEVDEEEIQDFDLDYTEVAGYYYTLVA